MIKIVSIGEIMLRLTPYNNERILQNNNFSVSFGGSEANFIYSLASFGIDTTFITKVPDNAIGDAVIKILNSKKINTDYIVKGGDRLGIFYTEIGSSLRPSKVIYDRTNSSFSCSKISEFNLKRALKGADIFHFSGITPSLSKNAAKLVEQACKIAKSLGITISCDLNYRKKLWTEEEARKVMVPLMDYVDICIGNEEDAKCCLGFQPDANVMNGRTDANGYKLMFKEMTKKFNFKFIATTLRESYSATHNGWKALLYDGNNFFESKHYDIDNIIDRFGAGDSFSAVLIYGLLTFNNKQKAVEFATAASALKHTIPGDFNRITIEEIEALINGDFSGRVSR